MHRFPHRRFALPSLSSLSFLIGTILSGAWLGDSGAYAAAAMNVASAQRAKEAGCDYYIITDASFHAQALRLAKIRRDYSPAVAAQPCIALMADIYKNHPPRGPKWTSLQDFLKAAYAENQATLSHAVFLGDASFDGNSAHNHVPAFTQQIRSLTRFSPDTLYYDTLTSDDAYSALSDSVEYGNGNKMKFAVGRIPARSPGEADAYLDKVEAYESHYAYGPQAFTYGFLSDDDLQKGSPNDAEPIQNLPELHQELWDYLPVKPFVRRMLSIEFPIQPDGSKPAAKDSTLGLFNAGPGRIYFIGHGSHNQLTDEKIFEAPQDLTRLRGKSLQPIISMLACTTARFAHPDSASMGELLLFHPNGAVAFLGGSIPTFPGPNNDLFRRWNALALAGGTVGRTFAAAKDSGFDVINNAAYILLGDPALSLRAPAFDLQPSPGSGAGRLVLDNAGNAGDSAYFQLVRVDSMPFNAVMNPQNRYLEDRAYVRETVVAEGRSVLGAGGTVTFVLPSAGDPRNAAVKAMTWNTRGMRYGHYPLAGLGEVALRPGRARVKAKEGYRLILRDGGLVLEGQGRRIGLDGRAIK